MSLALWSSPARFDAIKLVESVADLREFDSSHVRAGENGHVRAGENRVRRAVERKGGFQVASLKDIGHMPRLATGDGSNFRRPAWHPVSI